MNFFQHWLRKPTAHPIPPPVANAFLVEQAIKVCESPDVVVVAVASPENGAVTRDATRAAIWH